MQFSLLAAVSLRAGKTYLKVSLVHLALVAVASLPLYGSPLLNGSLTMKVDLIY